MTRARVGMLGLLAGAALGVVLLLRGAWAARDAAADDARTARAELVTVRAHLATALDAVDSLAADTLRARLTIDSLWRVAVELRARARRAETRWAVVRELPADTSCLPLRLAGDSLAVALAAETVRADTTLAQFSAFRDSVARRVMVIAPAVDSAAVATTRAAEAIRRPWHVRLWRGIWSHADKVVIGGGAYVLGTLR